MEGSSRPSYFSSTLSQMTILAVLMTLVAAFVVEIAILFFHVSIDIIEIILKPFLGIMNTLLTAYLAVRQMAPRNHQEPPKP